MFGLFHELRIRPIISGALTYIPGLYAWWDRRRLVGNTASAQYARNIWKFHLANYTRFIGEHVPRTVAEFGPGATLGSCISALYDGVTRAIAIDVSPYAQDSSLNLKILAELAFGSKYAAIHSALTDAILNLDVASDEAVLKYVSPWTHADALPECSVDLDQS
jgi:hypothetical protein